VLCFIAILAHCFLFHWDIVVYYFFGLKDFVYWWKLDTICIYGELFLFCISLLCAGSNSTPLVIHVKWGGVYSERMLASGGQRPSDLELPAATALSILLQININIYSLYFSNNSYSVDSHVHIAHKILSPYYTITTTTTTSALIYQLQIS
jgi:hypothetical protein